MKKQLLLGLMAIMTGFSACKKDMVKTPDATPNNAKQKVNVVDPGTVVELTLAPRQPGENFDTYLGNWGGVSVKMQGTPVWDHDKYPNLVNGVPCMGQGYSVGDQNQIATSNAGGQDFFIVGVATATFTAHVLPTFSSDVSNYANAFNAYFVSHPANAPIPPASNFVTVTYGDGTTGYVYVTGKLIRITTGTSHFAFATVGYPIPVPPTLPSPQFIGAVPDPNDNTLVYDVYGNSGNVLSIKIFKSGVEQPLSGQTASGTYNAVGGNLYHLSVTIHRADGTSFMFTGNLDIS